MHFSKLFHFWLALGSLIEPSLGEIDGENHLARRWLDIERRELQAEIRSLDKQWAIERRDLELELRSLIPTEDDLYTRALLTRGPPPKTVAKALSKGAAKAPAKGAPALSASKEKAPSKGGRKSHTIKPIACRRRKRSLDKRDKKVVDAGEVATGTGFDEIGTVGLKTCIGIAAVRGTRKVLAHITGGGHNKQSTLKDQLNKFVQQVSSWTGAGSKIHISFPNLDEAGPALKSTLEDMVVEVETAARNIDPNFEHYDRPLGASGEMVVRQDGKVEFYC